MDSSTLLPHACIRRTKWLSTEQGENGGAGSAGGADRFPPLLTSETGSCPTITAPVGRIGERLVLPVPHPSPDEHV